MRLLGKRLLLPILALQCVTSSVYSQSHYVTVSTIKYEGMPLDITSAQIRQTVDGDTRIYINVKNICESEIVSFTLWLIVYYSGQKTPSLVTYESSGETIPRGQIRNIIWDDHGIMSETASALLIPFEVELGDLTFWRIRNYFAFQDSHGRTDDVNPYVFPEVGTVSAVQDDIGLVDAGSFGGLRTNQVLGVIRRTSDTTEKIAHIRLARTMPTQSGFIADYIFPEQEIMASDRVQLLFPGISRLNATAKALGIMGTVSLAASGAFHYLINQDEDDLENSIDSDERAKLLRQIQDNRNRRTGALVAAGITYAGSVVSELLWSHQGKHLYPPKFGLAPGNWNTTTRTFLTLGAASIGAGLYYNQQKNQARDILNNSSNTATIQKYLGKRSSARNKRDTAYIFAGTAIAAGLFNQLFLRNSWDYSKPAGSFSVSGKNPVSNSFLLFGSTGAAVAAVFIYQKSKDNEKLKKAVSDVERMRIENEISVDRRRRDTALVIAGTALISSVGLQILINRKPGDEFSDRALLPVQYLPKTTWYFAGLTAVGAGTAFYFHDKAQYCQTRFEDAVDPDKILKFRKKRDDNRKRRSIAFSVSGIALGGALLSQVFFSKPDLEFRQISMNENNTQDRRFTWRTYFDPIGASAGISFGF